MSKLYEMHVYTMGTRTYADAICQVIDPDKRIFGGRILSRDESGSEPDGHDVNDVCSLLDQALARRTSRDCFLPIKAWSSSLTTGPTFGLISPI
jgi:hypothetical protein